MSAILTREQLVRDAVRLRRAHHRQPHDEDLAAVRASIERAAGPTVGRAASARLLGVSQTALDRWIGTGDVPTVLTPGGRREVPLPALVDLLEALDARRATITERHPLAAVLRERRAPTPTGTDRGRTIGTIPVDADLFNIDRETWQALDAEKRRLLQPTGLSIEEKLRRGQRLSAQAAALRRSIVRDEHPVRRS